MIWKPIKLELSEKQIDVLKFCQSKIEHKLSAGYLLKSKDLVNLANNLTEVVNSTDELTNVLEEINRTGEGAVVQLTHPDNYILSLPWSAARDNLSGKKLGEIPELYLSKRFPIAHRPDVNLNYIMPPSPLKVLIMISSPEDQQYDSKKVYRQHEISMLKSLEPLLRTHKVEVDFTDGCSLESLESKLKENNFHLLYFTGEGVLKGVEAHLVLEDHITFKSHNVDVKDFCKSLRCNDKFPLPMLILSLCQTGNSSVDGPLRGMIEQFGKNDIPAVVTMGMSIKPQYSVIFSTKFFQKLAKKLPVLTAFNSAIQFIYKQEKQHLIKSGRGQTEPLQWLYPSIYLNGKISQIVNWDSPAEPLRYRTYRLRKKQFRAIRRTGDDTVFIGRRIERGEIKPYLWANKAVLITGPAGVGKTFLAEYLVSKLGEKYANLTPFFFNESVKSFHDVLECMKNFLLEKGSRDLVTRLSAFTKGIEIFTFLLYEIAQKWRPVFVFDNLDAFQSHPGSKFRDQYQSLEQCARFLTIIHQFPVILICRFPLSGFPSLHKLDLQPPGIADFWKKCTFLEIYRIHTYLSQGNKSDLCQEIFRKSTVEYAEVVKLLYDLTGGNYKALVMFNMLLKSNTVAAGKLMSSFSNHVEPLSPKNKTATQQVGVNLIFPHLLNALDKSERDLLTLLGRFRIPVQLNALTAQHSTSKNLTKTSQVFQIVLNKLLELNLVDIAIDKISSAAYYYVSPLTRELLNRLQLKDSTLNFSYELAGEYHFQCFQNFGGSLTELGETFYHYMKTNKIERVQSIGGMLSDRYFNYGDNQAAFYFAWQVHKKHSQKTPENIWNRIGELLRIFNKRNEALEIYEKLLSKYKSTGDNKRIITALNNIGAVFSEMGIHDTALMHLKQSLELIQGTENSLIASETLRNIGKLYFTKGDYPSAIKVLEKSLSIKNKLGDEKGKCQVLGDLSEVYLCWKEDNHAVKRLVECVKNNRRLGNKRCEYINLNKLGTLYKNQGDLIHAVRYYEAGLKICREAGDKYSECKLLADILRSLKPLQDQKQFSKYLKELLLVTRQIGDKDAECFALNLFGELNIHLKQNNDALNYFKQSLELSNQFDLLEQKTKALYNLGIIYLRMNDKVTSLQYLTDSRLLAHQIKSKELSALSSHKMALIVFSMGNFQMAIAHIVESIVISRQIKDKRSLAYKLIDLANFYLDSRIHEIQIAKSYLNEALKINLVLRDKEITTILKQYGDLS